MAAERVKSALNYLEGIAAPEYRHNGKQPVVKPGHDGTYNVMILGERCETWVEKMFDVEDPADTPCTLPIFRDLRLRSVGMYEDADGVPQAVYETDKIPSWISRALKNEIYVIGENKKLIRYTLDPNQAPFVKGRYLFNVRTELIDYPIRVEAHVETRFINGGDNPYPRMKFARIKRR